MKDLKSRLLSQENTAHPITLLGTELFIRRLSAAELCDFENKASELEGPGNTSALIIAAAGLVLNALVDVNGQPVSDLPSPDELMKFHSYASITEAMTAVQRYSYGTLEDAKKN